MSDQPEESSEQRHTDLAHDDLEREIRQLQLMAKTLDDFRSNRTPIQRAINDLEVLAQQLHHASPAWHDAFVSAWADLEVPYAVALDQLSPIPDATDWTVRDGLFELSRLVAQDLNCGFDGRSTWSPTRTTAPALATPPCNNSSSAMTHSLAVGATKRLNALARIAPTVKCRYRPGRRRVELRHY